MNQGSKDDQMPWVIGHRGACGYAPENSRASINKAADLGVKCVEFDVKLTADRQPVLFHDTTLGRTSNGKGHVSQMTLEELRTLDIGSWFSSEFSGERIMTLSETIEVLVKRGVGAMVELKSSPSQEVQTGRVVAEHLIQHWPDNFPAPTLVSFSEKSLAAAREIAPELPVGLNVRRVPKNWQQRLKRLGCKTLQCRHQYLTRARAQEIISTGTTLRCFTVNTARRARTLASWGVHGIFSNFPDRTPKPAKTCQKTE
ncbi:MAG: glycerophosphodiester phosphodiesterase [Rhodospirillaceae bacterium]|jgi:glycerophosphoryl diester phosphodiesterase|nr:glycerophosphodiester phosphodiesterase [Rhodospirillales bacterium]MBT3905713.1 glycerophosphodiester phosphodiesterase [Rhodospirillaceae bacterium]MBT4699558.1 glycerophosphodiester phosphodiesterase [Rhodospirillaceae bacterium]MBT6221690.1 glycerophosphodiester phosphodiesterase [Rhodospirillaceae bacterium]MBT7484923.1 glycerophosphodiester phosphodiesterase [Rhodospirillales bacterium]